MRERTAAAVLRMLGKRPPADEPDLPSANAPAIPAFGVEERNMVSGVLTLAERSIRSIMTPRTDVSWINIDDDADTIRGQLIEAPHSFFPVCRGSLDEVLGIGRAKDPIADLLTEGRVRRNRLRDPIIVHEAIGILRLMDAQRSRGQLLGRVRASSLVTPIAEAIAGGLRDPIIVHEAIGILRLMDTLKRRAASSWWRTSSGHRGPGDADRVRHRRRSRRGHLPDIVADGERTWKIDGAADLHHVEQVLETEGLIDEAQDFSTLAGYLLSRFGHLPKPGDA